MAVHLVGADEVGDSQGVGLGPRQRPPLRRHERSPLAGHHAGGAVGLLIVRDARVQVGEVPLPGLVDGGWIGAPGLVHVLGVDRSGAVEEGLAPVLGGEVLLLHGGGGGGLRPNAAAD